MYHNKKIISLLLFAIPNICLSQEADKAWNTIYHQIENSITLPKFKVKDYVITKFGAISDNANILNHKSINKAIDKCSHDGGGRVVIPAGIWHTGPITLKSNVNLYLAEGATLLFTKDINQYPLVPTRWEGMDCINYQPMVYAKDQKNIAITGKGTLDGGGTKEDWWAMCGAVHYGWKEGTVSQRIGRPQLFKWAEDETPLDKRVMGDGYGMRPQLVNLYNCNDVLIEGIKLLRSPFWVIHPLLCTNITVRNVTIDNDGPNGDGCDPESCKNVLIEGCYFNTGDDCIAIKSGRNADGRKWNIPSENIIVRNCIMKNGHGGVVVGSEISGGLKNLFVENCNMDSPMLDRVIRIKTNTCRGGVIDGVYVRNINVGSCKEAVLKINLNYESGEVAKRGFYPTVQNVFLENVISNSSQYGIVIDALNDSTMVKNIVVRNSIFNNVSQCGNKLLGRMENVKIENLLLNGVITR